MATQDAALWGQHLPEGRLLSGPNEQRAKSETNDYVPLASPLCKSTIAPHSDSHIIAAEAPVDEFERHSVIHWFELLEERLLDFLWRVPLDSANRGVHSPQLAGIVLEAGGLLDSVLREISPDPSSVRGKIKPRGELDMADYEDLYGSRLDLPNFRSYVLVSPPQVRCPFEEWGRGQHLPWWADYNKIKHNRILNHRRATLDVAISTMCALHQILSLAPEFAEAVLRRHWLKSRASSEGGAIAMLKGEPPWASFRFLVGTKLFLVGRGRGGALPPRVEEFDLGSYFPDGDVRDFFAFLAK